MNNQKRILDPKRLVGVVVEISCSRCKKSYIPTEKDISLNGNLYYKMCVKCRERYLNYSLKYR